MKLYRKEESRLKRPFIIAGVIIGVAVSGWYLHRNQGRTSLSGSPVIPDAVWTQFVNVALIMFAAIYQANLVRRYIEMFLRRKENKAGSKV